MEKNIDLYSVLDLKPQEENQEIIKKKFKELIAMFHTDKFGSSDLNEKLMEAYKILSHPGRKFIYDNFGLSAVYLIKEDHELLKIFEYMAKTKAYTTEDIELIKRFIKRKIIKRINRNNENLFNTNELNTDYNLMMNMGLLDYLIIKYYHEREVFMLNLLILNKITISNGFVLYRTKDNSTEVSLNITNTMLPSKTELTHELGLNIAKKIFIPFKLFEKNFIDANFQLSYLNDFNLNSSFTVLNLFKKEFLELTVETNITLTENYELHLNDVNVGLAINASNKLKFRYGIFSKLPSINYETKVNKNDRLIWKLGLASRRFNFFLIWIRGGNKRMSSSTVSINDNSVSFANSFILTKKIKQVEFKSSFSFIMGKRDVKTSAMFSIIFKYSMLRIEIPLIITKENNIFTNSLIFLSTIVGNLFTTFLTKRKQKLSKHAQLYNRINRERQKEFNSSMLEDYERKVQQERNIKGLIVLNAYFGEFSRISSIYKHIIIFNTYEHDPFDLTVSDVKAALNLAIVNSKLDIPKVFTDLNGIFNPDYSNSNRLYMVVQYKYKQSTHLLLLKNNEQQVELPEH
jgi:hypothetical protein